jgi:hypothetical protein
MWPWFFSPFKVEKEPLKICKLYIMCTLILFNPPHLTIGSRLILTQIEF